MYVRSYLGATEMIEVFEKDFIFNLILEQKNYLIALIKTLSDLNGSVVKPSIANFAISFVFTLYCRYSKECHTILQQ